MKRLFVALNASDPLAQTFLPTLKKLKMNADRKGLDVRWAPLANYHITLKFLGNTRDDQIGQIVAAMAETTRMFPAFDLKIENIGGFSNEFEARVLYLGVQNKKNLAKIRHQLDTSLEARDRMIEFNEVSEKKWQPRLDERGEFIPHLTIGRLRNPHSIKDMISPFKRKSFGKIRVHELILYESIQKGLYSEYIPLARAPFAQQVELAIKEA